MAISNSGSVGRGRMNTKQVIIIRKDLNMRKGKMVAQGAHASMKAILDQGLYKEHTLNDIPNEFSLFMSPEMEDWLQGIFTKICVSVDSEAELLTLYNMAYNMDLPCSLIEDVGKTEFKGVATHTAVAIGPANAEVVDTITGHLKLL